MDNLENVQSNDGQELEKVEEISAEDAQVNLPQTENGSETKKRTRTPRPYPSQPFEEALALAQAIQQHAAGKTVNRLTLFDVLEKSTDSSTTREWIGSANKYGLIKGNYASENLELTDEGKVASGDEYSEFERTQARVNLAIFRIVPFKALYDELAGTKKFPARQFLVDIARKYVSENLVNEAVDIFTVNAKFVGLLRVMSGAERLVKLELLLDLLSNEGKTEAVPSGDESEDYVDEQPVVSTVTVAKKLLDEVCFYVSPIGEPGSEQRQHADLFMDHIIQPALAAVEGINLRVVRADKIESSGVITSQIIRHLLQARLVIADLSFHNPNVFYELAIRHASRLPTVHIIRMNDTIPFDLTQMRTVRIDTSSIYSLIPRLDTYKAEIAIQVRRALDGHESADNPISIFFPSFRMATE